MSGFTPGPWPLELNGDGKRYTIGKGLVDGPDGYEVAEVYSDDCDPDEAGANARLIAAAPELLAACRVAQPLVAAFKDDDCMWACFTQLTAAIAKALGTTPNTEERP